MKIEKKKLSLALIILATTLAFGELISWLFPNLMKSSPQLAIAEFFVLIIPVAGSMIYLTGALVRFFVEQVIAYDDKQKARQLSRQQGIKRNALVWFGLACGLAVFLGSMNMPKFLLLSERGVSVSGYELDTAKGEHIGYEFNVGPKTHRFIVSKFEKEKFHRGSKVTVVYDPLDPEVSIVGPVKPAIENELITIGMIMLVFPPSIMHMFKKWLIPGWKREISKRQQKSI